MADEITGIPNHLIDNVQSDRERQDSAIHLLGTDPNDREHTHSWMKTVLKMEDKKANQQQRTFKLKDVVEKIKA